MAITGMARLAAISLMFASLVLGATVAFAQAISLDEAVARAERQYKARVVRAEEKRHGDRIEYRIRLLGEDGRVFEVRVDAASGRED